LSPIIEEWKLNRKGYRYLQRDELEKAREIFKINMALYPNSANVYDSYAEALYKSGDTAAAIANYEKVLSMDSGNRNAKRRLGRLQRKQE
jgi:tetratricopeptide (TPR) repeat protein